MSYYCETCLRDVKKKSKHSHLESLSHKELEKYKHIILSLKNVDIQDVDKILFSYMTEHNRKFDHYFVKGEFELVFNINQDYKDLITALIDNKSFVLWLKDSGESIDDLKKERFNFFI